MNRETLWLKGFNDTNYPILLKDLQVEACVIGGGISGLLTGLLLQRKGINTVLLEGQFIGSGVSGHTSAHITSLLDNYYHEIIKSHGEDQAREVAEATKDAIALLEELAAEYGFSQCLEHMPVHYYAENKDQQSQVVKEKEAVTTLGFIPQDSKDAGIPFAPVDMWSLPGQLGVRMSDLLQNLSRAYTTAGGQIYEKTLVENFSREHDEWHIKANGSKVVAQYIVQCTHTPLMLSPIQLKLKPYTSYVLVGKPEQEIPKGLYYDMQDPYHYIRTYHEPQGQMLIIGGEDTPSGEAIDNKEQLEKLRAYAESVWKVKDVHYEWSSMFFEPADVLPYIGKDPLREGSFIATGYSGDGLMFATIGAILNSELIATGSHPWQGLFDPARFKLDAIPEVMQEGWGVTKHLIADRFQLNEDDATDIGPGEGKVFKRSGEKIGAARDLDNRLHLVSPICPHMKCILRWNNLAQTWDCGCHGSRFDCSGQVVSGPSTKNLTQIGDDVTV